MSELKTIPALDAPLNGVQLIQASAGTSRRAATGLHGALRPSSLAIRLLPPLAGV